MGRIENHFYDIGLLDTLAAQDTAIHRIDPRAKLITTLVFIATVVSFGKYEISALLPFAFYPVYLLAAGNLPPGYIIKKIILVSPFAVMVGIFNPLLDQETLLSIGGLSVSGGWVSFTSILLRFTLTVGAAMTFVAVTGFNSACMALERLGTPRFFAIQLLFLYRYLFVLVEEAVRMVRARSLRVFEGKGMGLSAYSSLLGHLLLRTLDRAQRIHSAMWCRGFDGTIRIMKPLSMGRREFVFIFGWVALFVVFRFVNLPLLLEGLIVEFVG
ncbi:MAG: cobalt ECF transporter T component CbiQ [bacterium]|nr:cobalt ECF transporter T component CbiQ [bacterium]MDT8395414.1 cobalt ECF transporter T component CbiQ [bacterium]